MPRPVILTTLLLIFVLLSTATMANTGLETAQWAEDVDYLITNLPKVHKNLFFKLDQAQFTQMATALKTDLPSLSTDQILTRLAQLVAAVGDSHTSISLPIFSVYPLAFYVFADGIYLLQADPQYAAALHCRLTKVGDQEIDEVIAHLSTVIPHENQAQLSTMLPQYLVVPSILTGLAIIEDPAIAQFTFVDENKREFTLPVQAVDLGTGLNLMGKVTYQPFYLKHPDRIYWWEYLPEHQAVYVNYSSCRDIEGYPVRRFTAEILDLIDQNPVEKLIVDLRNNAGGNSGLLDPFINAVAKNEELNQPGKIYVIIGRRTFSSAILNALSFKNKTHAVLVGEPTGGKPNHYGEVKIFTLPNSGLRVSYSTKYFKNSAVDTDSLLPDLEAILSLADYEAGRDPAMDAILFTLPR
ncbi:MAG: peptidase S41 [Firmicutes bacterium]|nr:peptidase S41 [Bacillota bacterium]